MIGSVASRSQRVHKIATPLCLPNNYKWDSRSGQCIKTGARRDWLYVVQEALQNLRTVKGKYHCLNKLEAFAIYLKKFNLLKTNFKVSANLITGSVVGIRSIWFGWQFLSTGTVSARNSKNWRISLLQISLHKTTWKIASSLR